MEICGSIDDIVWGPSDKVWDETLVVVMREMSSIGPFLNEIMKWVLSRVNEFEIKYIKVLRKIDEEPGNSEGVVKLMFHYQRIMLRYKMAYDSCKTVSLALW